MGKIVAAFHNKKQRASSETRVDVIDHLGRRYIEVRVFKRTNGECRPTRKGLKVSETDARKLAKRIEEAADKIAAEKTQGATAS